MGQRKRSRWWWVLLVVPIYIIVASLVYRFRHPDMTETELLMHTFDAWCWR